MSMPGMTKLPNPKVKATTKTKPAAVTPLVKAPKAAGSVKSANAKPGTWHGLDATDIPLSKTAATMMPSPDSMKKAEELTNKIAEYKAEIARLKAAQEKADNALTRAEAQKRKSKHMDPQLLKYFSYIEKHCSEYLTSAKAAKKLLYRGQDDSTLPVFVGYPREDREPKDSDAEAQHLADKLLKLSGFTALRSNSLFTTSNWYTADGYGTPYAIFPKNGFSFTWGTKAVDLVLNSVGEVTGDAEEEDNYNEYDELFFAPFMSVYEASSPNESGIKKAANKIVNDWYQVDLFDATAINKLFLRFAKMWSKVKVEFPEFAKKVKISDAKFKKAVNDLTDAASKEKSGISKDKKLAAKMIKYHGFTHKNLTEAIKSGNEVYILGEYVAVNASLYREELKKYFLPAAKGDAPKKPLPKDDHDDGNDGEVW